MQLQFEVISRQDYAGNNCHFAAGHVHGHPHDTIYLEWTKEGDGVNRLLLRPDEAQIIICVLAGALWSQQIEALEETNGRNDS